MEHKLSGVNHYIIHLKHDIIQQYMILYVNEELHIITQ